MSMAYLPEDEEQDSGKLRRFAIPAVVLIVIALGVWWMSHQQTAVERQANTVSTLMPVSLPPPPPPPPKVEQPKLVEQQVVAPTNTPPPPAPAPTPSVNNAITENAPAQDGTDAFNIGAGNGSGMKGGGGAGLAMNAAQYGQYARGRILAAVKEDGTLHGKELLADVRIWFDARGAITKVIVSKSTGTAIYDSELTKVLSGLEGFPAPPDNVIAQMPIQFTIDERHS